MNKELISFAARLRGSVANSQSAIRNPQFSSLALELFALAIRKQRRLPEILRGARADAGNVEHWTQIPAVPTGAFKELELSCIPPEERTAVFHSSGTTEQKPSRHFHNAESLAVYEASLWTWFERNVLWSADGSSASSDETRGRAARAADYFDAAASAGAAFVARPHV